MAHVEQDILKVLVEAKDKDEVPAGQVKPVPGRGLWKAKNKKGTVKVFTDTQKANTFAQSEETEEAGESLVESEFAQAFRAGLAQFNVTSAAELPEAAYSEFIKYVETLYKGE